MQVIHPPCALRAVDAGICVVIVMAYLIEFSSSSRPYSAPVVATGSPAVLLNCEIECRKRRLHVALVLLELEYTVLVIFICLFVFRVRSGVLEPKIQKSG